MKVKDLYDPAFFMVRSVPPGDRDVARTEPSTFTQSPVGSTNQETQIDPPTQSPPVIGSISSIGSISRNTNQPTEAERIVMVWREILGVNLSVHTVEKHLHALQRWESQLSCTKRSNKL